MPIYGYECLKCQAQFEVQQRITEDALTIHEDCGGSLKKLVYPVGIAFKGSGFYVNDYAPKASSTKSAETSSSSESKPAGAETPAAAKPESTSTPAPASTAAPSTAS